MKAHVPYAVSLLLAGGGLAAQQEPKPSETSPPSDFIEIIAISPSPETPLEWGKKVADEVSVDYELVSRATAFVRVLALDKKRKPIAEFSRIIVKKGRSTYKWAESVKIPKTGDEIHIVADLYEEVALQVSDDPRRGETDASLILLVRVPRRIATAGVQFETRQVTSVPCQ